MRRFAEGTRPTEPLDPELPDDWQWALRLLQSKEPVAPELNRVTGLSDLLVMPVQALRVLARCEIPHPAIREAARQAIGLYGPGLAARAPYSVVALLGAEAEPALRHAILDEPWCEEAAYALEPIEQLDLATLVVEALLPSSCGANTGRDRGAVLGGAEHAPPRPWPPPPSVLE